MKLAKKYADLIPCYSYQINWSDDDDAFVVHVAELKGCATHGATMEEAMHNALDAVEGWIEVALKQKMAIPEPISKIKASGRFIVRSNPELHQKLIQKSHEEGYATLNKFIINKLEEIVGA